MTTSRRNARQMAEDRVAAAERGDASRQARLERAEAEVVAAEAAVKIANAALHYARQHPLLIDDVPAPRRVKDNPQAYGIARLWRAGNWCT